MIVIDANGEYAFEDGTRTLRTSDHPVHQARVELALPKGSWLYASDSGHELARFKNVKQSSAQIEEFQKELRFYLKKYHPEVTRILADRNAVTLNMEIKQDALTV
jgi:hypothetical protein